MNWANGRLLPPISRFRINVRDAVVIGSALGCIMAAVSAIDVVWVRPLPFPDASRLVRLSECRRGDLLPYETTWGNFRNWDPRQLMLARVGAYKPADPVLFTSGEPQSLTVARITPSLLATLAVKPLRGRNLLDSDTDDGARPVMLTDQAWRRAFGRSEELVNATVTLDGVACTVVGIASPAIESLLREDILRPFAPPEEGRGDRVLRVVGRLRNGATTEGTTLALSSQVNTLEGSYPENRGFDRGLAVTLQEAVTRDLRQPTLALGALAAFLFFVMVVNVVGLRLASGESRQRDMAIRKMLGASTGRLLLDGLGTAVVTALLASSVGIAVWQWLLSAARQWTPSALMVQQLRLRPSLILVGVCTAFSIAMAGEVLSVLRGVRQELGFGLIDRGRKQCGVLGRQGLRAGLGLIQTTVAVVFTVTAVTAAMDARRRSTIDYGFDLSHLWAMDIKAMPGREGAIAAQGQELQRVVDSLASSPGVLSAGSANELPFTREPGSLPLRVRDRTLPPGERE
jgi:putative ABC transport system permease protein